MPHPTVSVVIITRNEESTIGACLECAIQQDYPNITEIIVVDGNSNDGTVDMILGWNKKDSRIRLLEEDPDRKYRGPSNGRKLGISQAKGKYVQLFNGDVTVERNYISQLVGFSQKHNLVGAAGLRWNKDASIVEDFINIRYWNSYLNNPAVIEKPPFLSSDAALYLRNALDAVGNYDESLTAGEDCDIGYRLAANGGLLRYDKKLLIYHKGGHYQTLGDVYNQQKWYGKGLAQLALKYPFRYAAEINKVKNFIILPAIKISIWAVLTLLTISHHPTLFIIIQLWPAWGILRFLGQCYKSMVKLGNIDSVTRIRKVCTFFEPVFCWCKYVVLTIFIIKFLPSPNKIHSKWFSEPLFNKYVKAANFSEDIME